MSFSFEIPVPCIDDVKVEIQSLDRFINFGQDYIDSLIAEAEAAAIAAGESVLAAVNAAEQAATLFVDTATGAIERIADGFENRLGQASKLMGKMMKMDISGAASGLASDLTDQAMELIAGVMALELPGLPDLPLGLPNMPDFSELKLC